MEHSKPLKQKVSGVVLIDKPKGLTSQQVVSKVKYLLKSPLHNSKKAGHTGTLDPMATGLLPICLGEATKFSHYQLNADKSYMATIKLGVQTDTGDAEGQAIHQKSIPKLNQNSIDEVAKQFLGPILQVPPMYSALKKDGKKLYEYARAGIEVDRPARPITIKSLTLHQTDLADELILNVTCSKGTYVRVLGEDIASSLGTLGHLTALRRTQVGHFDLESAISLDALQDLTLEQRFECLLGIDACVTGLPTFIVDNHECQRLHMGQRLNIIEKFDNVLTAYVNSEQTILPTSVEESQTQTSAEPNSTPIETATETPSYDIKLIDSKGQFLGLGQLEPTGRLQPKKMIQR